MKLETYRLKNPGPVISPALIYYKDIIEENIRRTIEVAGGANRLWPHVKSHKSADMVRLLMDAGVRRFKCATIAEGEMAGACGAEHAIISYPISGGLWSLSLLFPKRSFMPLGMTRSSFACFRTRPDTRGSGSIF